MEWRYDNENTELFTAFIAGDRHSLAWNIEYLYAKDRYDYLWQSVPVLWIDYSFIQQEQIKMEPMTLAYLIVGTMGVCGVVLAIWNYFRP